MSKKDKKEKKVNVNEENISEETSVNNEQNVNTDAEGQTDDKEDTNVETDNKENTDVETETQEVDPLEIANKQIEELKDKYLRAVAEFDNYKKRTLKEKTELILNGGEKTISAILPVIDDMERAIANSEKEENVKTLEEGWELIFKKLMTTLEGLGVKKIDTDKQDFNVDYHEAVAMVPGMGDDKKGKVIDCMQAGYTLNDKVIRHAKVAVGQ